MHGCEVKMVRRERAKLTAKWHARQGSAVASLLLRDARDEARGAARLARITGSDERAHGVLVVLVGGVVQRRHAQLRVLRRLRPHARDATVTNRSNASPHHHAI
eukprot:5715009-Pleurochrysis_carterae.AAC.1